VLGPFGSGAALLLRPHICSGTTICSGHMAVLLGHCGAVLLGLLMIVVLPLRCRRCCCRLLRLLRLCSHLPSLQTVSHSVTTSAPTFLLDSVFSAAEHSRRGPY
jgi:hypothetical protein